VVTSKRQLDAEIRYRDETGALVSSTLASTDAATIMRGSPVRELASHSGQRHYPGWLWMVTTHRLVAYNSLLERDRLLLADFDPAVTAIISRPFWVCGRDKSVLRRHVPDFLCQVDGHYRLVDVNPQSIRMSERTSAILDWTGRLCAAKGWAYEAWSGADPVVVRNVWFLASARRDKTVDEAVLGKVAQLIRPGMSIAEVESAAPVDGRAARAAILHLLWRRVWSIDLTAPLSGASVLRGERS